MPLILGATSQVDGTTVRVTGEMNRPPMERTDAIVAAFKRAQEIGRLIRRLRGTSKVFPVVLLHSFVPARLGLGVDADFTGSLYKLIEGRLRVPIVYADEEISARGADEEESKLLGIPAGSPVLVMERLTFTTHEKPIEFVRAVYRPEHYTFALRLRR